jgi:hypothetical protein
MTIDLATPAAAFKANPDGTGAQAAETAAAKPDRSDFQKSDLESTWSPEPGILKFEREDWSLFRTVDGLQQIGARGVFGTDAVRNFRLGLRGFGRRVISIHCFLSGAMDMLAAARFAQRLAARHRAGDAHTAAGERQAIWGQVPLLSKRALPQLKPHIVSLRRPARQALGYSQPRR